MAVRVYSRANKEIVEVSAGEAQRGILRGDFDIPAGTRLRVAKGNRTGSVSPADLKTALGQGARLVDDDEAERIKIRKEESSLAAGALGAVEAAGSSLSFGLFPVLQEALGADPRRLEARRETAGPAATMAEVGTAIASGGAGLLSKSAAGAAKFGLPALAARGGRAIEQELVRSGTRRSLATATGQAIEGIAYAAGAELDDSVLENRDMSAENVLAGGLMSGALGGTLGLMAPGISKVADGVAPLPGAAARKLAAKLDGVSASLNVPQNVDGLVDRGVSMFAKTTGGNEAKLSELGGWLKTPEKRARAFKAAHDSDGMLREVTDEVVTAVDEFRGALDTVVPLLSRGNKLKQIERLIPADGGDAVRIHAAARELDSFAARIDELSTANAATREMTYKQGDLNKAAGYALVARKEIEDAFQAGSAGGAFRALDKLKQNMDELAQGRKMFAKQESQVADTFDALTQINGRLRKHLEDGNVWGPAGVAQGRHNAAVGAALTARQELGGRATVMARVWDRSRSLDPGDVMALVKSKGKYAGEAKLAKVDDYLDAEVAYLKNARDTFEFNASELSKIDAAIRARENITKTLEKRAEDALLLDLMGYARSLEGGGSPSMTIYSTLGPKIGSALGGAAATGIGGMIGGVPGAMAGAALGGAVGSLAGSITRPFTSFRTIAALMHKADKNGGRIDFAVGKFLGKMRAKAGPAADRIGRAAERGIRAAGRAGEAGMRGAARGASAAAASASDRKEFAKKMLKRVPQLAAHPQMIADELRMPLSGIQEHLPMTSDLMLQKIHLGVDFLMRHMPAVYEAPFGNGRKIINTVEMARWERYVEVVTDPATVAERLAEGTLTKDHVLALREVYPEIYRSIVESVWAEMAAARDEGRTVPFTQRVKIGMLLDIQTDAVFDPNTLVAVQNVWLPAPPPDDTGTPRKLSNGPKISKKSIKRPDTTTPAQNTEV